MPIGAAAAAALGAGLSAAGTLGSQVGSLVGRKRQAKRANKWNIKQWERQNAYNHPRAQMQRLKEAGLNPNLIYGDSASGATGMADRPPTAEIPDANVNVGQIGDAMDHILKGQQIRLMDAQVNQTNAVTKSTMLKNVMQTLKNLEEQGRVPYYLTNAFNEAQLNDATQALQWVKVSGETGLYNARVDQIRQEIEVAIQTLKGKELENTLKRLHIKMRRVGLEPTDPLQWRAARAGLGELSKRKLPFGLNNLLSIFK
jgi:hypothetical protein